MPDILARPSDILSPRMVRLLEELAGDWSGSTGASKVYRTRSKPSRVVHSITSSARASIEGGSVLDYDGGSLFPAAMAVKYCPTVVFGGRFLWRKIIRARRYASEQPTTSERTAAQIGSVRNTAIPMNKPTARANTIG
jgi:hypothetical protein